MNLASIERILRSLAGLAGLVALGLILAGLARGLRQPPGRASGRTAWLRSPAFYVVVSLLYFALCALIWRPLGLRLDQTARLVFLTTGFVLFSMGLGLVLWGRLSLGQYYFGSTTRGAQLFQRHRLITTGPFALVRHPMYLGYLLVGLGGIMLFQTWTMVFFSLHFPALLMRAGKEEQVLEAEFGDAWREYAARVPAWLPRLIRRGPSPGAVVLLECLLLFLPAIPAYIWFWPNAGGSLSQAGEIVAYVYFAIGALWIGRRWPLDRLGINRRGVWLALVCGFLLALARTLVILGALGGAHPPALTPERLIFLIAFYFGLVGMVEELLFRGLIYRALEDWRGTPWAIWGSSLAFALWHVFGQGPLIGGATFFYGLIFALIRRRAGGILGLIFAHGFMDLTTFLVVSPERLSNLTSGQPALASPFWVLVGLLLLVQVPFYLWKIHPLWKARPPRAG